MSFKDILFTLLPAKSQLGKFLCSRYVESPVFIVGCGRSGTTAIADCLGRHAKVKASRNEMPCGLHLLGLVQAYSSGPHSNWYAESIQLSPEAFYSTLQRLMFESVWGEHYGLRRALGVLQGGLSANAKYTRWCAKLFPTDVEIADVAKLFSNPSYIYVVRNGAEVVASMGQFGAFGKMTFAQRCEFWVESFRRYDYLQRHELAITIRHENFVEDPCSEIQRICSHTGLLFEAEMLQQAQNLLTHSSIEQTDANMNVKATLQGRASPMNSWTAEQRATFEQICGPCMAELGYEPL